MLSEGPKGGEKRFSMLKLLASLALIPHALRGLGALVLEATVGNLDQVDRLADIVL